MKRKIKTTGVNVSDSEPELNQLQPRARARSIKVRIMNSAYEDSNLPGVSNGAQSAESSNGTTEYKELVIRPIRIFLRRFEENENVLRRPSDGLEVLKIVKKRVVRVAVNRVEAQGPSSSTAASTNRRSGRNNILTLKNLPVTPAASKTVQRRKAKATSNGTARKPGKQNIKRTSLPKTKKRLAVIKIRIKRNPKNTANETVSKQTKLKVKRKSARNPSTTKTSIPNGTKKPGVKKRQVQAKRITNIPFPKKMKLIKPWPTKIRNDTPVPSTSAQVELPKRYVGSTKAFKIVLQKLNIPGYRYVPEPASTQSGEPDALVPVPPAAVEVEVAQGDFKCQFCTREFQTKAALTRHGMFHNFACKHCPEKFPFESALNTHMLIHSEEMKYKCCTCGRRFKHIINFNAHTLSRQCSTADNDKEQ